MATFAQRLIQLRNEKQLSQRVFSKQIGIPSETYTNYESGNNYAKLDTLILLAQAHQVSLDYLSGHCETRTPFCGTRKSNFVLHIQIRTLRKHRKLTINQTAQTLGISNSAYKSYEMGKNIPPLNRLIALADLFGVSLDELVGFDNK